MNAPVYTVCMRLHRFFVRETVGNDKNIVIRDEQMIHQWKRVFRYITGDSVVLFDNSGYEYTATIDYIEPDEARLTVTHEENKVPATQRNVTVYMAITKKDTFECVLEKGTELGVARVIPVIAERSEKKDLNFERAQRILVEASEQSGRTTVPQIGDIVSFTEAGSQIAVSNTGIAFDPTGTSFAAASASLPQSGDISVCIGAEGGWSPKELEVFETNKIPVYSLGTQVLRAETAAIAVLSLLLLKN